MPGLDRLLGALDVTVDRFALCDLTEGRRPRVSGVEEFMALYVMAGKGRMRVSGHRDTPLVRDTFIILPRGLDHRIEPFGEAGLRIAEGPRICEDAGLVVAYGGVRATFGGGAGLFDALKSPIAESFADRPMRESFLMLIDELVAPSVGTRALTETILKHALILLMRRQSAGSAPPPWIAAANDARLAPALAAMFDRLSDPLSLDELARLAGMSRSVFAERFVAAFGRPPIDFLKDLRLGRAARLLAATDMPVKKIARAVGYESRSYFSRAFRQRYEVDPSDYRTGQGRIGCA